MLIITTTLCIYFNILINAYFYVYIYINRKIYMYLSILLILEDISSRIRKTVIVALEYLISSIHK